MSEDEIFQDICTTNGIDMSNEATDLTKIEYIEMFFLGYPRIACLSKFLNLRTLVIIGQDLKQMSPGLDTCFHLNELWICECQLEKIAGLIHCKELKKLYLYSNKITQAQNLNNISLEVLWLNDNKIERIEGIQHMKELKELNLAKNCIKSIGDSLNDFKKLENLNLSANLMNSFEDVINLQNNPCLRMLSFRDSQYGYCPITMLCNYSVFMIYHFPDLQRLDTLPVTHKSLKDLADATINKKKLWYNTKLNTLNREIQELQKKLEIVQKLQIDIFINQKKIFICKIKNLERFRDTMGKVDLKPSDDFEMNRDLSILKEKLNELDRKLQVYEQSYKQSLNRIEQQKLMERNLVFIELENGGNIKFECGKNEEAWSKSCHDLILSRFCSADYLLRLIGGIKIHKIIRITNRMLLTQFEENMFQYMDETDFINNKSSLRKQIDYLMYCWRPQLGSQYEELYDIIKNGFKDVQAYKKVGLEAGIPFSNSLSVSDYFRMESFKNQKGFTSTNNQLPFKHGVTLLCKVYTNNLAKYDKSENSIENYTSESSINPENYKDKLGVSRQFGDRTSAQKSQSTIAVTKEFLETQRTCDCKSRQIEYFMFNKCLAVPEYLIEFEYMNKVQNDQIYDIDLTLDVLTSNNENKESEINILKNGESMELFDQYKNNELAEKIKNDPSVAENLEEINLHDSDLSLVSPSIYKSFRNVHKLVISFNNITNIKDINYLQNLEYLDVSYNKIENLAGFKGLPKLTYLDISNNQITDFILLLSTLKQYTQSLNNLNISSNPFNKTDGYRIICANYLKNLKTLNNVQFATSEQDQANRVITLDLVLKRGLNLITRPRTLKHSFVTDFCKEISTKRNNEFEDKAFQIAISCQVSDQSWTLKVTSLNLDNSHLFSLSNINGLVNLRWATFNNNYLTKIEGIENCIKLEELTIENNYLRSLEGLGTLKNLRKLSLSNNEISYDNTAEYCNQIEFNSSRLSYLSISNNKIKSLKFIQKLSSLLELNANFNQISNIREIFYLKQIPSLVILDLWCNPMCHDAKYRLFIIYHLKSLKSLDGYPIETVECSEAKEYFGGKLTCDFIAEKFSQIPFNELRSLDLPQCSIRYVDLGGITLAPQQFENLRSLNLENNCLTSFSGLIHLKNLRTLCLNYNKIESIFPKVKEAKNNNNTINGSRLGNEKVVKPVQDTFPIMESLEVLHLGYNGISDLIALQINRIITLKSLFLQGNELTKIEGIENLRNLRELVLDKNKIKAIGEFSFFGQTHRLSELHIEENRLKDLQNIQGLRNIEKLFVANNKIADIADIDRMNELIHLQELSLINNPVTRRPHYRITVVDRLPRLKVLDMIEVNDDDRAKAELFFSEQYQQQIQQMQPQIIFNTAPSYSTQAAQLITSLNTNQLESQFMNSPRLKPILFMDKVLSNNFVSNNLLNNINNFQSNTVIKPKNTQNSNNSNNKGGNNGNYDKMSKESQAKNRNQF